ncbi:urease accessory protein UreH domain-containing protein [Nitratifractor sp.]
MEAVSLFGLFLMGLAYGSSVCTLSCSPMLVPLLATHGSSLRGSLRIVAFFGAGRILSYTTIAALASFASVSLRRILDRPDLTQPLMGAVMAGTALYLLYRTFAPAPRSCAVSERRGGARGAFAMGALLSLNLCAPLLSLVAVSAASGSLWKGALYGVFFGMGTVLVSLLFFGVVLAPVTRELLRQFSLQRAWIEAAASLFLLSMGILVMLGRLKL